MKDLFCLNFGAFSAFQMEMEPSNPKNCNHYLKAAFTPNPVLRLNSSGLCDGGTLLNDFITQQSAQLYVTEHKVLNSAKM